ncbi:hypothetical protein LWI29_019957 [Acer saccharum]|uniref:Cysteine-rich receptor-like protein kinase 25 n=1 Tax=Acer saccharum TaxID=4024 RepID=A0AA39RS05_ACESA|nr:hypothetical protein LWI29_019957 [Acer saccharum]
MPKSSDLDLVNESGHQHAIAYIEGDKYYGAKATINVWEPKIQQPNEFSLSQLWILGGSFGQDLNSIEARWQDDPAIRPTMSQVVLMLGSQAIDLPSPSTAPYSVSRFTTMSDESSTFGTGTGILTSDQTTSTMHFQDFFFYCSGNLGRNELELFCVLLWRVWFLRNQVVHGGVHQDVENAVYWAEEFLADFYKATSVPNVQSVHAIPHDVKWRPPVSGARWSGRRDDESPVKKKRRGSMLKEKRSGRVEQVTRVTGAGAGAIGRRWSCRRRWSRSLERSSTLERSSALERNPPNDTAATKNCISKLDSVLNSLPTKASVNSFYNESSDGVYILFLCRGDVSAATCQTCVKNATQVIRQQCSSNRTAIIWYNECMLHYSNTNFFGLSQTSPDFLMWNTDNITVPDEPNYSALSLVYSLIEDASNTFWKFGTDDRIVVSNGSRHGYALVQCARDIDNSSCRSCLWDLTEKIQKCCKLKIGWRIMSPSCNIRYEEYEFYEKPSPAPLPSVPTPQPTPNVDYQSIPCILSLSITNIDNENTHIYIQIDSVNSVAYSLSIGCNITYRCSRFLLFRPGNIPNLMLIMLNMKMISSKEEQLLFYV